jgi:tetratricopeptide (TPR) repeat protein
MPSAYRIFTAQGWLDNRPRGALARRGLQRLALAAVLWTVLSTGLLAVLGACSVTALRTAEVPVLAGRTVPHIPDADLLAVSPEMRQFTDLHARGERNQAARAWMLAYAALDPYLLDFEYDPMVTLPADEAFQARRGNCLTFSGLFVAMARAAGLNAWYQEVRVAPKWSAVNETLLVSKHVNAVVEEHGQRFVIDVSRRKPAPGEQTRRLSDREAAAQYYNNLGVDALVEDDLPLAYAYFVKALETQPGLAYLWSNLGVVFRRNAQSADAVFAYRMALEAERDHAVALNNLYSLYGEEGNLEAAARLERRVEANRRQNPYYLHHLAELANEEQRWPEAIRLLDRAIDLEPNEYRFYYTLAQAQYHTGLVDTAHANLDRARELAATLPALESLTLP